MTMTPIQLKPKFDPYILIVRSRLVTAPKIGVAIAAIHVSISLIQVIIASYWHFYYYSMAGRFRVAIDNQPY